MLNQLLASVHLLGLACGVAVLFKRAAALSAAHDEKELGPVFLWDNLAGLLAIVWIGSGLWRLFGEYDKGSAYYYDNWLFWLKMGLICAVFAVECVPMVTFLRWRTQIAKGHPVSLERKQLYVRLHWLEFAGMLLVVICASMMARGIGANAFGGAARGAEQPGARIYEQYCQACHQSDGRGLNGTLAADFVAGGRLSKADELLLRSIEQGVPGSAMPAFGPVLSEADRRAALAYVRARFGSAGDKARPQ